MQSYWCFSLRPKFIPFLYDIKDQYIGSIEKGSVSNTYDADAVSPETSLMGNCQNQVFAVGWGFLLSQYRTNSLDRSRWVSYLYLLCTFKILLYLSIDKYYNSQYNSLLVIPIRNYNIPN